MIKTIVMAGLFAGSLTGGASAETYDCKITTIHGHDNGLISRTLVITIPVRFSKTVVENPLVKTDGRNTVRGVVEMYSKERVNVNWELRDVIGKDGRTYRKLRYRSVILRPSNRINVSQGISGSPRMLGGSGKCVLRK